MKFPPAFSLTNPNQYFRPDNGTLFSDPFFEGISLELRTNIAFSPRIKLGP